MGGVVRDACRDWVLIVEDDPEHSRALTRLVQFDAPGFDVVATETCVSAYELIERSPPSGAIVDIALVAASGLEVAQHLCSSYAVVPTLVISGELTPVRARRVQTLGACSAPKPIAAENITAFVRRVERHRLRTRIERLIRLAELRATYAEILRLRAAGLSRRTWAHALGVTDTTLKKRVHRLLGSLSYSGGVDALFHELQVTRSELELGSESPSDEVDAPGLARAAPTRTGSRGSTGRKSG